VKKKKSDLLALAKKHGCTLEIDNSGGTWEITMEAPEGKIFNSSGCEIDSGIEGHGYINSKGNKINWDTAYNDVANIIACGFDDAS
jgi:hypothetical protein